MARVISLDVAVLVVLVALNVLQPGEARGVNATMNVAPNTTFQFSEDELIDSTVKPVRLDAACAPEACHSHCRQMLHAGGRCDADGQCQCRDLKQRGRCAMLNFGCGCGPCGCANPCGSGGGGGGMSGPFVLNNNNNNNFVIKGREQQGPSTAGSE